MTISLDTSYLDSLRQVEKFDNNLLILNDTLSYDIFNELDNFSDFEFSPISESNNSQVLYVDNISFNVSSNIIGVSNLYFSIGKPYNINNTYSFDKVKLINGNIWGDSDDQVGTNILVIDEFTSMYIFGTINSIGMTINLKSPTGNQEKFFVIGVVDNSTSQKKLIDQIANTLRENDNPVNFIRLQFYMPYFTYQNFMGNLGHTFNTQTMLFKATDQNQLSNMEDVLIHYNQTNYITKNIIKKQFIEDFNDHYLEAFSFIAIMIIISCTNMINVSLFSIKSRQQEIGIRRALGATKLSIYIQFTLEMIIFLLISGGIGISLSLFINMFLAYIFNRSFVAFKISSLLIMFLSTIILGIIFGIYPSYKASKINISESLRLK
jgi:putative ABC transport system permease protein